MKTVRIGGAASYYSDSIMSVAQLLATKPAPDYLIFDFMAEGTIARTARERSADASRGFESDFIDYHLADNLSDIVDTGVKLIANAGAANAEACARAARGLLESRGVSLKVAWVEGDDLLARHQQLRQSGITDMFNGSSFPDKVQSINAYLGGFPIARALAAGADIVITGRCADSALALGALIHEFNWQADDWDRLAAGTLVGHLLECGCQITGGTFTDWELVPDCDNQGFPIADVTENGECVITKPENTGGVVNIGTVAEQLLYETGDPRAYIVPDVVCDFSQVTFEQVGPDRVSVRQARGRPATDTYKVVATFQHCWRGIHSQLLIGINAASKARRQGEALVKRGARLLEQRGFTPFIRTQISPLGTEVAYGPHAQPLPTREVYLRCSVDHPDRAAAGLFCRESLAATSGMAAGTTSTLSVEMMPISKLFMFLVPKRELPIRVHLLGGATLEIPAADGQPLDPECLPALDAPDQPNPTSTLREVPLIDLAWARSGEKGNLFNIAVIARRPEYLPYLRQALSAERVGERFRFLYPAETEPRVSVFDVPGCHAINFLLHDSMDGGLLVSPRVDNAAKGMAQQLLELPVAIDSALL